MIEAYPLCWPKNKERTSYPAWSNFKTDFTTARDGLMHEIDLIGGDDIILSTNIEINRSGLPYANRKAPNDPGVAVYFTYLRVQRCFACDKWDKVKDNMQAIRKTIKALRGIARWGSDDMMQAAFDGFKQLAAPDSKVNWKDFVDPAIYVGNSEIEARFKSLIQLHHPDRSGNEEMFKKVMAARKAYRDER